MSALPAPFGPAQFDHARLLGFVRRHGHALFLTAMLAVSLAVLLAPGAAEGRCMLRGQSSLGRGEYLLVGLAAASGAWIAAGRVLRRLANRQVD